MSFEIVDELPPDGVMTAAQQREVEQAALWAALQDNRGKWIKYRSYTSLTGAAIAGSHIQRRWWTPILGRVSGLEYRALQEGDEYWVYLRLPEAAAS